MQQHKSNANRVNYQVNLYSKFLRILLTVIHCRLFGFGKFDENTIRLFTKHALVSIPIKNLD